MLANQVLFEDSDIIVVYKPAGVATQTAKVGQKDMVSEVKNHIRKSLGDACGKEPYLALIHRLDQPVEGILVMGKTPEAAAHLNKQLTEHMIDKYYLAAVCGKAPCQSAAVVDYLLKDEKTNLSGIVDQDTPGAKKALLEFEVVKEKQRSLSGEAQGDNRMETISLLSVHLITGRHHQIRVQMSGAGIPLLGDQKYGTESSEEASKALGVRNVALCSNKLSFLHPTTNERLSFEIEPKGAWFRLFG